MAAAAASDRPPTPNDRSLEKLNGCCWATEAEGMGGPPAEVVPPPAPAPRALAAERTEGANICMRDT